MHFSFFTHPLHFWLSPIQPGSSYILKISVTYGKMWSKISVPARADHSWWSASAGWFLSAEVSQRLWGSAAAVVSSSDPVWSSCHVWEAVTDLWFLCLCLGWPALSNLPHVWALCAAFEPMFPWCDLHFCVKGRWTLWRAGCLWSSWLHVPCVQLSVGASSRCYSWNREEESERFPLVMENMPNISRKKKVPFFCFLPASSCFGFSFLFFYNCRRFQFRVAWGFSSCGKSGCSWRITQRLCHAKSAASLSIQTSTPPLDATAAAAEAGSQWAESTAPCHRATALSSSPLYRCGEGSVPCLYIQFLFLILQNRFHAFSMYSSYALHSNVCMKLDFNQHLKKKRLALRQCWSVSWFVYYFILTVIKLSWRLAVIPVRTIPVNCLWCHWQVSRARQNISRLTWSAGIFVVSKYLIHSDFCGAL